MLPTPVLFPALTLRNIPPYRPIPLALFPSLKLPNIRIGLSLWPFPVPEVAEYPYRPIPMALFPSLKLPNIPKVLPRGPLTLKS